MTSVKKTLQSLFWTLWPQTTENTKSMGILGGIQLGYDNGQADKHERAEQQANKEWQQWLSNKKQTKKIDLSVYKA